MVDFCIRIIARFFAGEKQKLLFRAGFFFAHERGVVKIVSALSRLGGGALGRVLELHAPGAVFLHERERILEREARPLFDRRAADDENKFPARPLGAVFFKRCADRRADDLLVQLRELAPERNVPVAEHIVKIAERFRELVRCFVKDDRPVFVPQRFEMLLP